LAEIGCMIVGQANGVDARVGQDSNCFQRRAERVALATDGRPPLGNNAFEVDHLPRSAVESRPDAGQWIRPIFDLGAHSPSKHHVAAKNQVRLVRRRRSAEQVEPGSLPRREELA
jgi:hypothetical protein